jgi:hypothetical protein
MPAFSDNLYVLPVKLPQRVLSLMGYFGVSQLLMIYQTSKAYYAYDGVTHSDALLDQKSLDILFNHPLNKPPLEKIRQCDHSFFHSGDEPTDCLMLNEINLRLYSGPVEHIKRLIKEHALHGLHDNPLASHLTETQIKKYTNWGVLDEAEKEKLAQLYSDPTPEYRQFMAGNHQALSHWLDNVYALQEASD